MSATYELQVLDDYGKKIVKVAGSDDPIECCRNYMADHPDLTVLAWRKVTYPISTPPPSSYIHGF